jgi:hypothetical protein
VLDKGHGKLEITAAGDEVNIKGGPHDKLKK